MVEIENIGNVDEAARYTAGNKLSQFFSELIENFNCMRVCYGAKVNKLPWMRMRCVLRWLSILVGVIIFHPGIATAEAQKKVVDKPYFPTVSMVKPAPKPSTSAALAAKNVKAKAPPTAKISKHATDKHQPSTKKHSTRKKRKDEAKKTIQFKAKRKQADSSKANLMLSTEGHDPPSPPELSVLLIDARNGKIILQSNCNDDRYPASLTKLMTLYLAFSAIKNGTVLWTDKLTTSSNAASQVPSKLGLAVGEKITMRDAIMSLIIKSANDAAVVTAEHIGKIHCKYKGSANKNTSCHYSKTFVDMMNKKARELGMHHTRFINPSGLHNEKQKTTAVDMATMASALKRDFPNYYGLFSQTSHPYKGKDLSTTNEITKTYPGAEGMKTGYTRASGYNLVTTVRRDNMELIGVVMGGESAQSRNYIMTQLLDLGIKKLSESSNHNILMANQTASFNTSRPKRSIFTRLHTH